MCMMPKPNISKVSKEIAKHKGHMLPTYKDVNQYFEK